MLMNSIWTRQVNLVLIGVYKVSKNRRQHTFIEFARTNCSEQIRFAVKSIIFTVVDADIDSLLFPFYLIMIHCVKIYNRDVFVVWTWEPNCRSRNFVVIIEYKLVELDVGELKVENLCKILINSTMNSTHCQRQKNLHEIKKRSFRHFHCQYAISLKRVKSCQHFYTIFHPAIFKGNHFSND